MEVLVRWKCSCMTPLESCRFCQGSGHIDRWMLADLLGYIKEKTYVIIARRKVNQAA
jgi:hypothetical protein